MVRGLRGGRGVRMRRQRAVSEKCAVIEERDTVAVGGFEGGFSPRLPIIQA